ncbi:MAG: alpha/beta hydrolase [Proteobacteria bacterium]|nr:alpha/beta hydrolase [Pseudomonadota bacterium]
MTPEAIERGYNNRQAVPDFQQWFDRWARESADVRAAWHPQLDVRFGPGPKETLDLFLPRGAVHGTLLFLHGGYWRSLDKADHSFVAPAYLQHGYAVAVANYDLAPAVSIAAIVDEARRALAWVWRHGPAAGASTECVAVAGHSAGGHLAAMLMATDWSGYDVPVRPLHGALTLSGVHDLRPLVQASMNADLKLDDAAAAAVSPALLAPRVDAPLVVAAGADETSEFLRQTELLADAWGAGTRPSPIRTLVVPRRHHFNVLNEFATAGTPLADAALALLGDRRPRSVK